MSTLSAQGSNQIDHLSPKCIKEKGEDKVEIIIIKVDIKLDIDQTVERYSRLSYRGRPKYG